MANDWIKWEGGECPVEDGTLVEVKFKNEATTNTENPTLLDWRSIGFQSDIIAYRLHQPEAASPAIDWSKCPDWCDALVESPGSTRKFWISINGPTDPAGDRPAITIGGNDAVVAFKNTWKVLGRKPGSQSALQSQEGGDHYKKLAIQPMEYSMANKLDACQHTVIKYVTRFRDKGGIEDLKKAIHTIKLLAKLEYNEEL